MVHSIEDVPNQVMQILFKRFKELTDIIKHSGTSVTKIFIKNLMYK